MLLNEHILQVFMLGSHACVDRRKIDLEVTHSGPLHSDTLHFSYKNINDSTSDTLTWPDTTFPVRYFSHFVAAFTL